MLEIDLTRVTHGGKIGDWARVRKGIARLLARDGFDMGLIPEPLKSSEDWFGLFVNGRMRATLLIPSNPLSAEPAQWPGGGRLLTRSFLDDAWSNMPQLEILFETLIPGPASRRDDVLDIVQDIVRLTDDYPEFDIREEVRLQMSPGRRQVH